jgi:hypothetical protein
MGQLEVSLLTSAATRLGRMVWTSSDGGVGGRAKPAVHCEANRLRWAC